VPDGNPLSIDVARFLQIKGDSGFCFGPSYFSRVMVSH